MQKLPDVKREHNKKLVLLLTGLESSIRMVGELGDYPPVLVDLKLCERWVCHQRTLSHRDLFTG